MISDKTVERLASFFKVLGDETRVRIICAVSEKEKCVSEISDELNVSQSAVSHQLKLLKMEGHVKSRRDGKNIYYSIDDEHVLDIIEKAISHIRHKFK